MHGNMVKFRDSSLKIILPARAPFRFFWRIATVAEYRHSVKFFLHYGQKSDCFVRRILLEKEGSLASEMGILVIKFFYRAVI